jgi:radical SAM superfamily enzyme YgiQ (UPF0313 family)
MSVSDARDRLAAIRDRELTARGRIRAVLINSPLDEYEERSLPKYDTIYPFGLLVLAEVAKAKGIGTIVLDAEAMRLSVDETCRYVEGLDPELVGINLLSPTVSIAAAICERVSKRGRIVVAGGPHATFEPEDCFERIPTLRFLFRGEAACSWEGFIAKFLAGGLDSAGAIDGVSARGEARGTLGRRSDPLDGLPEVDRSAVPFPYYLMGGFRETSVYASMGCTERCRYCAGRAFSGGRLRFRSIPRLVDEIERCCREGIESFHFADDDFVCNHDYVQRFSEELGRRRLRIRWRSFAKVNSLAPGLLADLNNTGCYRLTFGVETGSETTLRRMGKGHSVEEAYRAIRLCREAGIETKAFFMLGYPGETAEDIEASVSFALESGVDWAYFYLVRAFPGTVLFHDLLRAGFTRRELLSYRHWVPDTSVGLTGKQAEYRAFLEDNGFFKVDSVLKYNVAHQRSINEHFTNEELSELMAEAYRRFYYRYDFVRRFGWADSQ